MATQTITKELYEAVFEGLRNAPDLVREFSRDQDNLERNIKLVGSIAKNLEDFDLLSLQPDVKDIVKQKFPTKDYVSLFPVAGESRNAVEFMKKSNALFIQELNEFNTEPQ